MEAFLILLISSSPLYIYSDGGARPFDEAVKRDIGRTIYIILVMIFIRAFINFLS